MYGRSEMGNQAHLKSEARRIEIILHMPDVAKLARSHIGLYAPINVKPQGKGMGNPRIFDSSYVPKGWEFDSNNPLLGGDI